MAKQKSDEDLNKYLKDHLKYEREMLGFTYKNLFVADELTWCAMFECFGIHSRNLYDFLRHEGKPQTTIRADDYIPGRKKPDALGVSQKMNISFFHLSTFRIHNKPVNIKDAIEFGGWIDKEWGIWTAQLPDQFKNLINPSPVCPKPPCLVFANTQLTTSSQFITSTNFTYRSEPSFSSLSIFKPPPTP